MHETFVLTNFLSNLSNEQRAPGCLGDLLGIEILPSYNEPSYKDPY